MGNIFLFTLIIGVASALLLVPIYKNEELTKKEGKNLKTGVIIAVAVILMPTVFAFYYFGNFDRNLSSLWPLAILLTGGGTVLATGRERKIKILLLIASLVLGGYFLTAFLFNADEKYEITKMDEKVEIKTLMKKKLRQVFHHSLHATR